MFDAYFTIHIGSAQAIIGGFGIHMRCRGLDSESGISYSRNSTPSKGRFKLIAVAVVVAVLVVVGALLVSAFIAVPEGQDAWLFKGAYATYEGSTLVSAEDIAMFGMSLSVDFSARQEVVDFNDTHALVSTSFRMSSSFGELDGQTVEDENSMWVPLSQIGLMNAFEDVDLTNSYESTVDIAGFGTRTCTVYEYSIADEGLAMKVFMEKAIGWPLKMKVSMIDEDLISLSLDINLVETNIAALK